MRSRTSISFALATVLHIACAEDTVTPTDGLDGGALEDGSFPIIDRDTGVLDDGSTSTRDSGVSAPPTCGGGASFVGDHLLIPATGPRARALGLVQYRLVVASWSEVLAGRADARYALRAAGFGADGRVLVEGQYALDGTALSALGEDSSVEAVLSAIEHAFEDVDGAPLAAEVETALWSEIASYLEATPCVLELEPWLPYGIARSAISIERGASARCDLDAVDSFREWIRAFPRLFAALSSGRVTDVPGILAEAFRRAAEFNCCAGANTPWLGITGCTCEERFGPAFPVRHEYPDPNGGFGAEHVCEPCDDGLEWSEQHGRCAAPLDDDPGPELGVCPADVSGDVDYEVLRGRLEALDASSPFVVSVEVRGASGGSCAPIQRTPLYVPCDASDGVPYLARPAGGAIDTNPTAGLLGRPQWLWHVSYAVQGMLDRGLLAPGDIDGTGSLFSTGGPIGEAAVSVCDRAMGAGPFGGRALVNPIVAFPDREVPEEERIAAGLDPGRTWCADELITKFSTSMLLCNPSRIRGSNFVVLFPETPLCGGERPPDGVEDDASRALCVCPLDAPRWDAASRSCLCEDDAEAWDPVERRCRPEERCFGALGSQCTPLQRDAAFTGLVPVSCGADHIGPAPEGVACTSDPFFRPVTDASERPMQWQSVGVGSLRHDQCCRKNPQGFFCGRHGSQFGPCRPEFNLAIADFFSEGALWGRLFDPERPTASDIFDGGDAAGEELTEYGRTLRAAAGANVRDGDAWVCASGQTWEDECDSVCAPDLAGRGVVLEENGIRVDMGVIAASRFDYHHRYHDGGGPYTNVDRLGNERPVYRQGPGNTCGAEAVAMVLGNQRVTEEIIDSCNLEDGERGTTALQLAVELRARDRLYSSVSVDDVWTLVQMAEVSELPVIAMIDLSPGDVSRSYHWIVLDEPALVDWHERPQCLRPSVIVRDSLQSESYVWSIDALEEAFAHRAVIPGSVFDEEGLDLPLDVRRDDGQFQTSWESSDGVPFLVDGIPGDDVGARGPTGDRPNPWPTLVRGASPYGFVTWDDLMRFVVPPGSTNRFTSDPNHERGFRYEWQLGDGRRVTVWGHGPTANPNAGVNATSGPIVRIRVGSHLLSERLRGHLVRDNRTNKNETHIPLVGCPPAYCLGVPTPRP
jgi:hypothetical protein